MDQESRDLLVTWFNDMPEWLKHGYANCPVCNRVMVCCAEQKMSFDAMMMKLSEVLYFERNRWRDRCIHFNENSIFPTIMPTPSSPPKPKF